MDILTQKDIDYIDSLPNETELHFDYDDFEFVEVEDETIRTN